MLRASIDLGTNTCLMLLAEVESGQIKKVSGDYARIIRLGEGVDQTRSRQPKAIERTLTCLSEYKEIISEAGISPGDVVCVATSQARDASNGEVFFDKVEEECGLRFRVLSGKVEARLSFMGSLLPGMDPSNHAVVDIGGGSTEFVTAQEDRSVDLGSVRFTERYLKSDPVTDEEFRHCLDRVDSKLEDLIDWRSSIPADMQMLAVAGTATTLASWHLEQEAFNATEVEKVQLSKGNLQQMVADLKSMTVAERREQVGIEPKRADVLLAGAMIMWRTMEKLRFPNCSVSSRGLRYGVLMDLRFEI
jgi:exopolyphosphatase / guanosine-5'-triphosphate,3'-diphosphate pyrophosphatase